MANKQQPAKKDADEKMKDEFIFKYDPQVQLKNREAAQKEEYVMQPSSM